MKYKPSTKFDMSAGTTRLVKRDPFAREELHERTTWERGECDWCGSVRILKSYENQHDDSGRTFLIKGRFCSRSCFKSYHS